MLSGENSIITQAIKGKEENKSQGLKEEIKLACEANRIKEYTTGKNLEEELNKISNVTIEKLLEDTFYVKRDQIGYTVYEDGTVLEGKIDIWDGSSELPEIKDENWYISTGKQLKFLSDFVNNGNQLTEEQKVLVAGAGYGEESIKITDNTIVYLMNNIDLGARHNNGEKIEGTNWTPIGKSNQIRFKGTFDGNNHIIRGIYIKSTENNIGVFGVAESIKNLTIENGYIEGNTSVGGIAGTLYDGETLNCKNTCEIVGKGERIGGICGQNGPTTKITNCENIGKVIGKNATGGVSGATFGTIEKCKNSGEIIGEGYSVGGIVGNASSGSNITSCENIGKITANGNFVGGISGAAFGNIEQCKNSGEVIGEERVGGIVGEQEKEIIVTNCENIGKITVRTNYGGGISGVTLGNIEQCKNSGEIIGEEIIGGIAGGNSSNTKILNCENIGKVTAKKQGAGGISGAAFGNIEQCKNSGEIIGEERVGGILGEIGRDGNVKIINNYNEGTITGISEGQISAIGGIIGWISQTGTSGIIENNYNKGDVKGIDSVGGIIGINSQTIVVKNCYNKGNIEGKSNLGGVIGKQEVNQNNLSNLYYLKTIDIGAISGVDYEEKKLKGIDNDFNDLSEFINWLENTEI